VLHLLSRLSGYLPALVALALPTVFTTSASDSFILPRASIVIAGACLGIALALLIPRGPGLASLRWPLLAAAATALLAFIFSISQALSLAGSYTRYESLPMRLSYLGLLAASVWLLRTQRQREWVVAAFVFGTAVTCLEAVQQWAGHVAFRPDGNLGNANLLAALVATAAPLAIYRGLRGGRFFLAWWAAVIVLGVGLFVTTSRSGLLGTLAGCAALGAFSIRPRRLAVAAGIAGVGVVGAAVAFIQLSPLRALNDDPASLRLHLWQDGLHMIAARPITGWGEDATGLAFGRFLSQDYASLVTFDRVHSGPLDIAATQGILGLAALSWILVVLFVAAWRHRLTPGTAALAGALVGYSVWVLFNFDWAPATGAFWLLAGVLWSETSPPHPVGRSAEGRVGSRAWRSGLAVILVIAAAILAVLPVLADAWYVRGRADLAVKVDPYQAQYHWVLGEGLIARGDLAGGTVELQRAADLGETEPGLYVELGDRQAELGNRAEARADYRRALVIDPFYTPAQERLAAMGA
jgi:O-antigen ligase